MDLENLGPFIFSSITFIIGFFGNLICLMYFGCLVVKRKSSNNIFFSLFLTFNDLIVFALFGYVKIILDMSVFFDTYAGIILHGLLTSSILILSAMSYDRYRKITKPLSSFRITKKAVCLYSLMSMIACIGVSFFSSRS